jgi:hypothetical protein
MSRLFRLLIATPLFGVPFTDASAQASPSSSPRAAAFAYVLEHEAKFLAGKDFDLATETDLVPSSASVRQQKPAPLDSKVVLSVGGRRAREVGIGDAMECSTLCRPVSERPLVIIGSAVDSVGFSRVAIRIAQRHNSRAGVSTGDVRLIVQVKNGIGGWTAIATESAIAGNSAPKP